jgi:hypothetical protein
MVPCSFTLVTVAVYKAPKSQCKRAHTDLDFSRPNPIWEITGQEMWNEKLINNTNLYLIWLFPRRIYSVRIVLKCRMEDFTTFYG